MPSCSTTCLKWFWRVSGTTLLPLAHCSIFSQNCLTSYSGSVSHETPGLYRTSMMGFSGNILRRSFLLGLLDLDALDALDALDDSAPLDEGGAEKKSNCGFCLVGAPDFPVLLRFCTGVASFSMLLFTTVLFEAPPLFVISNSRAAWVESDIGVNDRCLFKVDRAWFST